MTPTWVTALSALLTPIVAVAVAWISFQQWRTAKAKLNLDTFAKRSEVYENAYRALVFVARDASTLQNNVFEPMFIAWRDSQFLFGREVTDHLDKLLTRIGELQATEQEMQAIVADRQAYNDKKWRLVKELAGERTKLIDWFLPYMLIDDRRVRGPREVVQDLNRKRWSYADDKQKGTRSSR